MTEAGAAAGAAAAAAAADDVPCNPGVPPLQGPTGSGHQMHPRSRLLSTECRFVADVQPGRKHFPGTGWGVSAASQNQCSKSAADTAHDGAVTGCPAPLLGSAEAAPRGRPQTPRAIS